MTVTPPAEVRELAVPDDVKALANEIVVRRMLNRKIPPPFVDVVIDAILVDRASRAPQGQVGVKARDAFAKLDAGLKLAAIGGPATGPGSARRQLAKTLLPYLNDIEAALTQTQAQPAGQSSDTHALDLRLNDLILVGNRLSFAAQTTGGTAGRDDELVARIAEWQTEVEKAKAIRRIVKFEPAIPAGERLELQRLAARLGEPSDPFAAWEALERVLSTLAFYANPQVHNYNLSIAEAETRFPGVKLASMIDKPGLYRVEAADGYVVPLILSDDGRLAGRTLATLGPDALTAAIAIPAGDGEWEAEVDAVLWRAGPMYPGPIVGNHINGDIYGDRKGRFTDGTNVTTSKVKSVEGNIIHTGNSTYRVEWHRPADALSHPEAPQGTRGRTMPKLTEADRLAALRKIQLMAGHELTQLTSNHPYYRIFEDFHRIAAGAQLATSDVVNERAFLPRERNPGNG